ncbi:MAG: tetratricopeptide repeat protein [Nitrospirota bacterium]|nr:tetratricopeptide repeat protein [Nitrospirota bacterium]
MKRSILKSNTFLIAALLAAAAVYFPALHGGFQFDDYLSIAENPSIKNPSELLSYSTVRSVFSGGRPLTLLTFALNYAIGGLAAEGYHILNLLAHLAVSTAVFFFVLHMIYASSPGGDNTKGRALLVAAIFALHPVQTGAVSYIVQRAEVLAAFFYLLSLYCLIRYLRTSGRKSAVYWATAMVLFLAGIGFKETVVTVPVMFFAYALFFEDRARIRKAAFGISPLLLAGVIITLKIVLSLEGSGHAGFAIKDMGQPEYFYTQMRVLVTYVRLIFLPVNQNLDYDYPLNRDLFDLPVIASSSFLFITVIAALSSLKASGKWKWPLRRAGFGMIWFIVILLPTSSFVPLKDLIFEHRVYLALAGIALTVVSLGEVGAAFFFPKISESSRYLKAVAVLIVMLLAVLTYERNRVWESKPALWQDVVAKSPANPRAHYNLGVVLQDRGEYAAALDRYLEAIRLTPGYRDAYTNLGTAYVRLGMRDKGIAAFRAAGQLSSGDKLARFNLGVTYLDENMYDDARREFEAVLALDPNMAQARQFLDYLSHKRKP